MSDSPSCIEAVPAAAKGKSKKYVRAVSPRLRQLLYFIFSLLALLGANSAYLVTITTFEWLHNRTYQNYFYLSMFIVHLILGLVLLLPFVLFGVMHMIASWNRRNRRAVKIGYNLFFVGLVVLVSGIALVRIEGFFELKEVATRRVVYWLHVTCPLIAVWLYWLHRLCGPRIKWRVGLAYGAGVAVVIVSMVFLQTQDPRRWYTVGPKEGSKYFEPSFARTSTGNFIPAEALMMDEYCKKCHQDIHDGWFHSAHHLSSFNNRAYLASIRETREVALQRDGSVKAARFCAACHDPVPFFSGAFDHENYDDVDDPTAHAGITCTVCHAITNINSNRGNGDYTIEQPLHYPFATSQNKALQFLNNTLVKAKPSFHNRTFLKDFHKSSEFCSVCHKVHLPKAVTDYKDFLRGQNHYDSYLLSGISGHSARSFYYPEKAEDNCNGCHMPLQESSDFAARQFDDSNQTSIHRHLYPSANTALAWMRNESDVIESHKEFRAGAVRVDIFGVKEGGQIDGRLHAPLRPTIPALKRGQTYLFELVIRNVDIGHHFTQGTTDSNQVWFDVAVTSGDRVIGRSGAIDEKGEVDPWSHFVNVFMLDRNGRRIDRRNVQDIFVPLYDHQIPPGAAQVVHYVFRVPPDITAPVVLNAKLRYRKFDSHYTQFIANSAQPGDQPMRGYQQGEPYINELPAMVLAEDKLVFPVADLDLVVENDDRNIPEWQRWNDYGIGLLLKGKGELRQATEAFAEVEAMDRWDGPMNLARAYNREGRIDEAVAALQRAAKYSDHAGYPRWTWAWLSGVVNRQQGRLDEAILNMLSVLEDRTPEMEKRGFDFSLDYHVINLLGQTRFDLGRLRARQGRMKETRQLWQEAIATFKKTLEIDSENVTAHHNLQLLYAEIGEDDLSKQHERWHRRYKPDDNARGRAVRLAREKYPAANHAAEAVVRYLLQRPGTPGLAVDELGPPINESNEGGSGN